MALVYKCSKNYRSLNWTTRHPRGIAYETATHFVHFCGNDENVFTISSGLTVAEHKNGLTLNQWVTQRFGAQDVQTTTVAEGHVVNKVWRPGLYYTADVLQAMSVDISVTKQAERSLVLLLQRVSEILNFIEPSTHGLLSFGHKTRELLILACTDAEDHWTKLLRTAGVTKPILKTNDFIALKTPFHLQEFEVSMPGYPSVPKMRPFGGWIESRPTQSLGWYDAYNKVKHDKSGSLQYATLQNAIGAVAANIALFCAQFGPHMLYESAGTVGSHFNELFSVELVNPDFSSFYAPLIDTANWTSIGWGESRSLSAHRIIDALVL
jgi:hypothetical protein